MEALLKIYPEAATPKQPGTPGSLIGKQKSASVLDVLLNRTFSLEVQNDSGSTALHIAALNGHKAFVEKLIDQLFNVNIKDDSGNTALHLAAWSGHVDIMRMLIKAGSAVNEQNAEGNTPLHYVAQYGKEKAPALLLLESKANPVLRNKMNETPLDTAARFGRTEVVSVLATANILGQIYKKGMRPVSSPLHLAARNGHTEVIKILLQAGVVINSINHEGNTALHEATQFGKRAVVLQLLQGGASVKVLNDIGQTPLQLFNVFNSKSQNQNNPIYAMLHGTRRHRWEESLVCPIAELGPAAPFLGGRRGVPGLQRRRRAPTRRRWRRS